MQFQIHGHRHGDIILGQKEPYATQFYEICDACVYIYVEKRL